MPYVCPGILPFVICDERHCNCHTSSNYDNSNDCSHNYANLARFAILLQMALAKYPRIHTKDLKDVVTLRPPVKQLQKSRNITNLLSHE